MKTTVESIRASSRARGRAPHSQLSVRQICCRVAAILTLTTFGHLSSDATPADETLMMEGVVAHEYGPPEVLKFEEIPRPEPKENEAVVRVIASSVNPADPLTLSGKYAREFGTHLPLIPGYDIAGMCRKNRRTDHETQSRRRSLRLPDFRRGLGGVRHRQGMGSSGKAQVSQLCGSRSGADGRLDRVAGIGGRGQAPKLQPGQTILIHGGSGGVGSFVVQIAKALGARVIATASTANQDLLKQLGADEAVDYTKTRFEDVAKGVDAVLDPVGKDTLARSYGVVKKGGIVMSLVARPDPAEIKKRGIRGAGISVHPDAEDLGEIARLIDAGKVKPIVTQVLPLSEAIAAQRQAATHHTRGKVVLRLADEPKG
jgi:NADPH:quinone reductase-like Zn-dependent oxidoreductase